MKFPTVLLLLVASSCLFQTTLAGLTYVPADLLEDLNTKNEVFETSLNSENIPDEDNDELPQISQKDDINEEEDEQDEDEDEDEDAEEEKNVLLTKGRPKGCSIEIRKNIKGPAPLFLTVNKADFFPINSLGYLELAAGKTIQMYCSKSFKNFNKQLVTASCVSGKTFRVDGTQYELSELACTTWPSYVAKKTGRTCNRGIVIQVGFEIDAKRFVKQMEICFNEKEKVTYYVHHSLKPSNNFYQTGVERISFQPLEFFNGTDIRSLYRTEVYEKKFSNDLGGQMMQYFDKTKNFFLSRGHMAAKADFIYGSQQRATFIFINVAPQWQSFNSGNWAIIENGLRSWVSQKKINVECYTGVYGVTSLPNSQGQETPLYLAADENNNGLVPVPKLYFRIVLQPSTKKGIVFLGVNNPHLTIEQIERDYIICKDVSDKVKYIKWKRTDIRFGYSYACEVSDFVKAVENVPNLSAPGGLLI